MRLSIFALSLTLALPAVAQTDIWLIDFNDDKKLDISTAKNITNRKGYDNQPSFSQDGKGLYYTKMLSTTQGEQQADIFYYNFMTQSHANLTRTQQTSEYSPLETPLKDNQLSIIKVEPDGVQRLWTVNTKSGQQAMLNREAKPVGYHAWGKNSDLTTFVLGEPMTLQYLPSFKAKSALKIDKNIGRSIRYNAKEDWFSYSKGDDKTQTVWAFDANTKQTNELISLPPRSQYYTWLNSHTLLSSKANQLVTWNINSEKEWETLADVSSICSTGISRIAVNKDQSKLALVCNEATSK
ncbi:hypothetical protein GCM10009128_11470 [Psychrosphaera haliotis]|uniref:TolB family protein n=1 Tax=Psychrosphaera haliotis TaxID=555083 RepID=UPI0031CE3A7E